MPANAALTVKKFDGTTDIVYAIKTTARGDGAWTIWRQDAGNAAPPQGRPMFYHRVLESKNGVRRTDVMYDFPYTYVDSTTSQPVISPLKISFKNGVWTVPQGIPSGVAQEAGAQFSNLMGHALIRLSLVDQTSFT